MLIIKKPIFFALFTGVAVVFTGFVFIFVKNDKQSKQDQQFAVEEYSSSQSSEVAQPSIDIQPIADKVVANISLTSKTQASPEPVFIPVETKIAISSQNLVGDKTDSVTGAVVTPPSQTEITEKNKIIDLRKKTPIDEVGFILNFDYAKNRFTIKFKNPDIKNPDTFNAWLKNNGYEVISKNMFIEI